MKGLVAGIVAFVLLCSISGSAQLPTTKPLTPSKARVPAAPVTPKEAHRLEPADLEAFFDGIFSIQLERSDIAGATVLVMKDGRPLLQKGYGYADWEKKTPVDPAATAFRLASISKLFTWVAVMQLVEEKKLDLDADVNQYLDFTIRPAFGKPVTLRTLMTHTGGFEEETRDLLFLNSKGKESLGKFLKDNQPDRMYPPGVVPAYSNYGVGLAGYIVQRVSGEPFEQYVREHIFAPLEMTHSSFDEPLPAEITASQGYKSTDKKPFGFEIFQPAPAGGVSSTASDMGRFGEALLSGGQLDGHRILKPETVTEMWTPQFRASSQLPAACMGFYQRWRNQLRFVGHEGDLMAFHSMFFLEPDQKLLLFVSYNSRGSQSKVRDEIMRQFADRYYPSSDQPTFKTISADEAKEYAGTYVSTRRADSTKLAMANLMMQTDVSVGKDGVLTIADMKDARGHASKFKMIGKDLWQQTEEQRRLFFIRDGNGQIVRIAFVFPGVQAERVEWWEQKKVILPMVIASLATLLFVVLAILIRFFRRLLFRKRVRWDPPTGTIRLSIGPQLAAWAWLAVAGAVSGLVVYIMRDELPPTHAFDKFFMAENVLVAVALLMTLWAVVTALAIWFEPVRIITRVKFAVVALACIFLSFVAVHWNIIGSAHRY